MDAHAQFVESLASVLEVQGVHELRDGQVEDFTRYVERSQRWRRLWQRKLHEPEKLGKMDILRWTARAKSAGDRDEALWRAFLAAHFGRASVTPQNEARRIESAGKLLCGFSDEPVWTWQTVVSDLPSFAVWLDNHRAQLVELRFGNHRKYESKQPANLFAVVGGFAEWVSKWGGTPEKALSIDGATTPEAAFGELYQRFEGLYRFGRTGRFDLLLLLAEMDLITARPGSCCLRGATGPVRGARKLWGALPVAELERRADDLTRRVPLPFEIVEDALCNWQK